MSYCITGLPIEPFAHLFGREPAHLARYGAHRYVVDETPGYPCRVTLEDAAPGERVLLLNYVHQPADTPYRSAHAIFVREGASHPATFVDEVPPALLIRPLSVRAFDAGGMMIDADLVDGARLESVAERFLANEAASYLHVHYALRGCYAARIDRLPVGSTVG